MKRLILALTVCLALAVAAGAAPGEQWGRRSDGFYTPSKLAGEVKDYSIILSQELAADKSAGWVAGDDTISSASWVYGAGITGGPESLVADPKIPGSNNTGVSTWFSDGTAGQKYAVTVTIHTTMGRIFIFPFKIEVR